MFLAPFMSRSITRLQLEHLYTSEEPTSVSNPHLVNVLFLLISKNKEKIKLPLLHIL